MSKGKGNKEEFSSSTRLYDSSSILSIGFTASRAMSSATSTVGHPYFRAL